MPKKKIETPDPEPIKAVIRPAPKEEPGVNISEPQISATKQAFIEMMEAYKKQNPVKFAHKKEAFEKKLATL